MSAKKPYDEKKILQLVAQSSTYAFTQVYEFYRPRIYRVALKFLRSQEMSEEIVQDVFLKIWLKRTLMTDVLNFDSFIFSVTKHAVLDAMDKLAVEAKARKELSYELKLSKNADEALIEKQYDQVVWELVDQLPPQQKKIFRMVKVDCMSHEAIGRQLKLSKDTVKAHMKRALITLRAKLNRHISTIVLMATVVRMLLNQTFEK